jgi:nucleoside 2-deoxyribosyltransferase
MAKHYHLIATLAAGQAGSQQKSIFNKTHEQALDIVTEFMQEGTITTRWGNATRTRQALELRIFQTNEKYNKTSGTSFSDFAKRRRNVYPRLEKEAEERLPQNRVRVFVVMPIQGDEFGSQTEQQIKREYDERFQVIEGVLQEFGCVAIRIDKQQHLGDLVSRIKQEIHRSRFVIADLTDERPSCYFEVGYAEALGRPVLHVASRESIMEPGAETKIHFDIHSNVRFFTNHTQLAEEIKAAVEANEALLLSDQDQHEPTLITWGALRQLNLGMASPQL